MLNPVQVGKRTRYSYARIKEVMSMPHLLDIQRQSYEWFKGEGLAEIFRDVSPITDFSGNLELFFEEFSFGESKYSIDECKRRDGTYAAPVSVRVKLLNKSKGDVKEQKVFMGDFPIMTDTGTFIINGAERVIVSQLVRSPGAYFEKELDQGKAVCKATIIPNRGAWIELETDQDFAISVRVDRTRKMPLTYFLRAIGFETNDEILDLFDVEFFVQSKLKEDKVLIAESLDNIDSRDVFLKNALINDLPFSEIMSQGDRLQILSYLLDAIIKVKKNSLASAYKSLVDMLDADRKAGDDTKERALINFYARLRPGEPPSAENAQNLLNSLFCDPRRYDLAKVGRYKINKKLGWKFRLIGKTLAEPLGDLPANVTITKKILDSLPDSAFDTFPLHLKLKSELGNFTALATTAAYDKNNRILANADILAAISYIFDLAAGIGSFDDIDHLGNRRVRAVGELLQNQFRVGMSRMERVVRERMTSQDADIVTPQNLINIRPVVAAIKEFFGSSQLSQFMDQHNPLSELTHKRRLSALGPGGLSRERAGFEVRDVHISHYGRMCPIETPEGPNIGLIGSLSNFARVNQFGFIETPYRIVDKINKKVTQNVQFLSADDEISLVIAQANEPLDENDFFANERVTARLNEHTTKVNRNNVDLMDVSPKQVVSIASALIPFLEHDDANRALMGANMQRQAVPLLKTQAPIVGTGMEAVAAAHSGVMVLAKRQGIVSYADSTLINISPTNKKSPSDFDVYYLKKFVRSNQGTCINQIPIVHPGDHVEENQPIADGPATSMGELALGYNIIVAYMPWEGYNYEDAILLSENLLKRDIFTSIHIEEYQCDARDTKLGPEEVTRDIPNVAEDSLANLDSDGIIAIGSDVQTGDILVGKVTPKGETELTAEERLLRAIFGEKAREVRDSSLRVPHGESGKVVAVNIFTRDNNDDLPPGVNMQVCVFLAQKRKISVGDKMSGRHGNKGVVSAIRKQEDMPFLADGTPVDIVLNPLGVPSRMNIGQILEAHLGFAVLKGKSDIKLVATPVFDGARQNDIQEAIENAGLRPDAKSILYDGRTGEPFMNPVSVGCVYMLKLHHLVDDKIHARSTGPYSLVTQQPLGGKAQFGGQRFGEMEVWALEAYGAAFTLQEILTVKSDDVLGRVHAYEAIVKGQNIPEPGVPESFKVLIKELQSIALDICVLSPDSKEIIIRDPDDDSTPVTQNPTDDKASQAAPRLSPDVNFFDSMRIAIASPDKIRLWSHGEVKKPETINYRTLKPERDGLFCEKIFGPTRDWECHCGKYKRVRYKGIVCDRCGVEVTRAKVRRERMGHIELAAPVSHIWYFKGIPSRMGLLLDMSPRSLEKVLYFASYVVLDPGIAAYDPATKTGLQKKDLLTEGMFRAARDQYGAGNFKVGIGAEAIQELLRNLDLEELSLELRQDLLSTSGQKKLRAIRRLEVVEAFRKSGNKPEWMILTVIPVIPPDLRPMVQLDGGRFATSDLNDLYRRVINRNNRLNRLLALRAPDIITRNEKRMLQEAVDALIDNGRRGRPVTGPANRPLKSLSDLLKGKQGRFRQNLLGKRVDYSGRSVIVVGPTLKLHQCGIPKEMALELFKPFVMKKLSADAGLTIKAAKKKVDRASEDVWAVLEQVIQHHPVLLNRAPTLHRLGIQAFEPVLTEGRALKLHPLACTAYNADFDGDQMAIHLPLSAEAQAEARVLMLAANHILAPKDGKPIIVPTQDMVLGTYYLTKLRGNAFGSGLVFANFHEALLAYYNKNVHLQAEITVRLSRGMVKTSVGRLIFNEKLPEDLRHYELDADGTWHLGEVMNKKTLAKLVAACYNKYGATRTAEVIDEVKNLGYHYACLAGMTVAISDVIIPPMKKKILADTAAQVKAVENYYARGILTERERYDKVCALWSRATDLVADAMMENMDEFNPIYMMSDSGARGNKQQMRQLAGMRGLMADPSGKIIDLPITANFREGLSVSDYFISSHGARKGLADTALRTADSGYLTRRLVDVAQDVIVRQVDCDVTTINLQLIRAQLVEDTFDALELFDDALIGRVLSEDAFDPVSGEIVLEQNTILSSENLVTLGEHNVPEISLRGTALTKPHEANSRSHEVIKLGAHGTGAEIREHFIRENNGKELAAPLEFAQLNVGDLLTEEVLDAALDDDEVKEISIRNHMLRGIYVEAIREENSEREEELTFGEDYISAPVNNIGVIEPLFDRIVGRVLAEDIVAKDGTIIARINDSINDDLATVICKTLRDRRTVKIKRTESGIVLDEDIFDRKLDANEKPVLIFAKGTAITDSSNALIPALANALKEPERVYVRSVLTCRSSQGVCIKCYGQDLANKTQVEIGEAVGIIAAQSIGEPGTQLTMRTFHTGGVAGGDITQGLPRVEELFEARKPKVCAVIAEISGIVSFETSDKKDNLRVIRITPAENDNPLVPGSYVPTSSKDPRDHKIPFGANIIVKEGDFVSASSPLTDGAKNPHDILRVSGLQATYRYLVKEVQKVYKSQGVEINDKHIEVMVRQMLHKVRIEDSGSTEFLPGEFVDINVFEAANTKAIEDDQAPAVAKPLLLGITKASLATDSFLSAASFQETTRVLTDAAIKGKVDPLIGLKENVIIGKLIPAGTGMTRYRGLTVIDTEAEEEQAAE